MAAGQAGSASPGGVLSRLSRSAAGRRCGCGGWASACEFVLGSTGRPGRGCDIANRVVRSSPPLSLILSRIRAEGSCTRSTGMGREMLPRTTRWMIGPLAATGSAVSLAKGRTRLFRRCRFGERPCSSTEATGTTDSGESGFAAAISIIRKSLANSPAVGACALSDTMSGKSLRLSRRPRRKTASWRRCASRECVSPWAGCSAIP